MLKNCWVQAKQDYAIVSVKRTLQPSTFKYEQLWGKMEILEQKYLYMRLHGFKRIYSHPEPLDC